MSKGVGNSAGSDTKFVYNRWQTNKRQGERLMNLKIVIITILVVFLAYGLFSALFDVQKNVRGYDLYILDKKSQTRLFTKFSKKH